MTPGEMEGAVIWLLKAGAVTASLLFPWGLALEVEKA